MRSLAIDIETYSGTDIKCGTYRYVEDPDFTILMLAVSFDGKKPFLLDLARIKFLRKLERKNRRQRRELKAANRQLRRVLNAVKNPSRKKTAFNANFERTCLAKYFGIELPPEQWECTMVRGAMLGLPMSLDSMSKVLKLDEGKSAEGKALIRYFSIPCKPTKTNGGRTRNLPEHDPEKWQRFCDYCRQDVVVEQAIRTKLEAFPMLEQEARLWALDQRINDRGVLLDPLMIRNAIAMDGSYKARLVEEAKALTNLSNPNSLKQLIDWLNEESDLEVDNLRKATVPELLKAAETGTVRRVLEIRQEMSKTSVKKYAAMRKSMCEDMRVRGITQFYGAGRTGRWAGRIVQFQNLPQNKLKDLGTARQLVAEGDMGMLELMYGNVPDILSQLIRTAIIAASGHRLIVADFAAIEARVIAWLAGEQWRLDVFANKVDIYAASASQMFNVPVEAIIYRDEFGEKKHGPRYDLRQKGKVAELALGYQGGPYALETMGALKMGLQPEELQPLVDAWRGVNKKIVKLWYDVQDCAIAAVSQPGAAVRFRHGVTFQVQRGILFITLPSGRRLAYFRVRLAPGKFGRDVIKYEGMDQKTNRWTLLDTYGGKLVENIVQAIARDCLAESLLAVDAAGYSVSFHVHDEIVCEVPDNFGSVAEVCEIMGRPVSWAPTLPLKAEGYETSYYKKD